MRLLIFATLFLATAAVVLANRRLHRRDEFQMVPPHEFTKGETDEFVRKWNAGLIPMARTHVGREWDDMAVVQPT